MTNEPKPDPPRTPPPMSGVVVYPSLHWRVSKAKAVRAPGVGEERFDLGEKTLNRILPHRIFRGDVVMIEGERGTFKTAFALNFLAQGLYAGESVVLISLANRPQLLDPNLKEGEYADVPARPPMIAEELFQGETTDAEGKVVRMKSGRGQEEPFRWAELKHVATKEHAPLTALARKSRVKIHAWRNIYAAAEEQEPPKRLVEITFEGGTLLPEEFVQVVCDVLEKDSPTKGETPIRRVALDDVSLIGLSYPFLRRSETTGDLFLSHFVDLMRKYGVDLVMAGTTGHLEEANEAVQRAVALADAVVSCRYCNVFGNRYVTVRGQGTMVAGDEKGASRAESLPAVVRRFRGGDREGPGTFELDLDQLEGLVGFESGEIRRPGVLLYLFSQYKHEPVCLYPGTGAGEPCPVRPDITKRKQGVHERYNALLQTLIESAFGRPQTSAVPAATRLAGTPEVSVISFDSTEAEAVHDSLELLRSGPIDRTVIYSVDEFCSTEEQPRRAPLTTGDKENNEEKRRRHIVHWEDSTVVRPYYANVLLLAYRMDVNIIKKAREKSENRSGWLGTAIKSRRAKPKPPRSWADVVKLADALYAAWGPPPKPAEPDKNDPPPTRADVGALPPKDAEPAYLTRGPAFWFDRSAPETLSCALMDALIAAKHGKEVDRIRKHNVAELWDDKGDLKSLRDDQDKLCKTFIGDLKTRSNAQLEKEERDELMALTRLFNETDSADPQQRRLPKNACVYLCWYSQLRDLIDECPDLAERLNVFPLPAGGFTGDWFVGIARGSVSIGLGQEVLDTLCSPAEEYKRFARGVGLPTLKQFYSKGGSDPDAPRFFAWPRGEHVDVERLLEIHFHALSREFIPEYRNFRAALATVALQLTPMTGWRRDKPEDWMPSIQQNVSRLPGLIQALCKMAKEEEEKQAAKQQ